MRISFKHLDATRYYRYVDALFERGITWYRRAFEITMQVCDEYESIPKEYFKPMLHAFKNFGDIVGLLKYHTEPHDINELQRLVKTISTSYLKYKEIVELVKESLSECKPTELCDEETEKRNKAYQEFYRAKYDASVQ